MLSMKNPSTHHIFVNRSMYLCNRNSIEKKSNYRVNYTTFWFMKKKNPTFHFTSFKRKHKNQKEAKRIIQ